MADLEIFQHPLAKWVHNKTPFVVTTSQIRTRRNPSSLQRSCNFVLYLPKA